MGGGFYDPIMASERPIHVALVSLGCPKNLVDSERMLASLAQAGCVVGATMSDADVIVVNTCGFLGSARAESMEVIAEALEAKRRGRARRVVVAGCLVDRDAEQLYQSAPGIDAIVGVNSRDEILSAVVGDRKTTIVAPYSGGIADDSGRFRLTGRHSAYLRIAEGCSQRCSFCTIPAIRGPFRSKRPSDVLAEAEELIRDGAVELNVIAQDTTGYGRDLGGGADLASLLASLGRLDGVRWVRLLYAYPRRFTNALIDTMADEANIVPYVDVPIQHISDPVLRRMKRGLGRKQVEGLLRRLRERIDPVVIRTTLLVGFPGETDEHFQELLEFVREFRFDALGVFEFSPEAGTPAADMPDAVAPDVRTQRREAIMLAQQEIVFAASRRLIGSSLELLVDGVDDEGYCFGRHSCQAPDIDGVCFLTHPRGAGEFVTGEVIDTDGYDLIVDTQER